ncbi:MAG TPA: hypothetical protein PLW65_02010 [Pseudomonadota bacterium]|nr:hypothetical protein [Pseudomonadota bacterium]
MTTRAKSTKESKSKSKSKSVAKPAGRGKAGAAGRSAGKRPAGRSPAAELSSDEALRALPADYAASPDMPVKLAQQELGSLARLAKTAAGTLAKVGITAAQIEQLRRFATRLGSLEGAWQRARSGVTITAIERRRLTEAEELERQLLAGGRWACRKDPEALAELARIAEGSGLADTIQDLRDLVAFWEEHRGELALTDIKARDLARATELVAALAPAAEKETASITASAALELRNRCFWAADELAKEIREGGRYAYRLQPKTAAKFISRFRASLARSRRERRKSTGAQPSSPPPAVS